MPGGKKCDSSCEVCYKWKYNENGEGEMMHWRSNALWVKTEVVSVKI